MKCEKKGEKNDFVIPLMTRFTLGWVSCFRGNIATSEMWGGICLILHADLCFGITLEIVMLGFQAVALLHWPSPTSIKNILQPHCVDCRGTISEAQLQVLFETDLSSKTLFFIADENILLNITHTVYYRHSLHIELVRSNYSKIKENYFIVTLIIFRSRFSKNI